MGIPGVYDFEGIDETLPFVPLAGRRVLDAVGRKLSLEAWLALSLDDRKKLVEAGRGQAVDATVVQLLDDVARSPARIPPEPEPDPAHPPAAVVAALGSARPLGDDTWRALQPLERYALRKYASKPEKLHRAYDEIVRPGPNGTAAALAPAAPTLTHLDERGAARMVDVGTKPETTRAAIASARVVTTRDVVEAIAAGTVAKGDVLASARIAGILAAKRTPELIPLCHPVRTTHASVERQLDAAAGAVAIRATVEAVDRTGVEMEAMVAASVAALTLYDMIKSADRWARIDAVILEEKRGGKSGHVTRPRPEGGS